MEKPTYEESDEEVVDNNRRNIKDSDNENENENDDNAREMANRRVYIYIYSYLFNSLKNSIFHLNMMIKLDHLVLELPHLLQWMEKDQNYQDLQ